VITGRENYRRAIEFRGPDYLPLSFGCMFGWLYEKNEAKVAKIQEIAKRFRNDIVGAGCWFGGTQPVAENSVRRWKDEWGTGWEDDGHGAKTEIYPMEEGYHLLEGRAFPDAEAPGRWDWPKKVAADRGDRYFQGSVWFTLFERLWMLRGFNNMLMDPYVDPANFFRLRDKVLEVNLSMIDKWIELGADGVYFSDDWGCQRGLLMNPDDWRKFYKPAYAAMFDRARRGGLHVWMHLCGDVSAIVEDLIDIGLSVLNPVQPQAMDVRQLSRDFGGKVCFWGGVDVQGTLVRGTAGEIRKEIDDLVQLFGRFNGGYIGGTSHSIMPETPLDNIITMYETFLDYL